MARDGGRLANGGGSGGRVGAWLLAEKRVGECERGPCERRAAREELYSEGRCASVRVMQRSAMSGRRKMIDVALEVLEQ